MLKRKMNLFLKNVKKFCHFKKNQLTLLLEKIHIKLINRNFILIIKDFFRKLDFVN